MEDVFIRYVFDKKNQATDKVQGLLQIEVRKKKDKKTVLLSTDIHLYKGQFDASNGFTCVNHPNAEAVTQKAWKFFRDVHAFAYSEECESLTDVKNWNRGTVDTSSFIGFMHECLAEKNYTYRSLKVHEWVISKAKEAGLKTFKSLTYEGLRKFDAVLRKTLKNDNTLNKRHVIMRWYCTEAVKRGKIANDPYDRFTIPKRKATNPVFLTEEEMLRIEAWEPLAAKLQDIKDLFVFQMYTGLAYTDLTAFRKKDVMIQDGYKVIRSSRIKTDESFLMLFLPKAEAIAEKWDYHLPIISNQKYNDFLKLLAAGAGINKKITTHTARHTYATWLLNKGVPVESVSRALGHSSIKMTTHYAKMLGSKVIEDMKKLL